MPSVEQRLTNVEHTLRLMQREHASQRGLHVATLHDLHDKIDTLDAKVEAKFTQLDTKIDALEAKIEVRLDTMQADISAILTAIGKIIKP